MNRVVLLCCSLHDHEQIISQTRQPCKQKTHSNFPIIELNAFKGLQIHFQHKQISLKNLGDSCSTSAVYSLEES